MKADWACEGSTLGSTSVSSNVPAPLLVTPHPFRVGPEGQCSLFPGRRRVGSRKATREAASYEVSAKMYVRGQRMRRNGKDEGELVTKHHGNLFFLNPSGGPGAEHSQAQVAWFTTPL